MKNAVEKENAINFNFFKKDVIKTRVDATMSTTRHFIDGISLCVSRDKRVNQIKLKELRL